MNNNITKKLINDLPVKLLVLRRVVGISGHVGVGIKLEVLSAELTSTVS